MVFSKKEISAQLVKILAQETSLCLNSPLSLEPRPLRLKGKGGSGDENAKYVTKRYERHVVNVC